MSRYIAVDSILARWYRTSVRGRTEFDQVIANIPSIDLEADYVPRDYYNKVVEELCRKHTEEIASMPSVVRCKECKWNENTCVNHGVMKPRCRFTDYVHSADDFCSYGERAEQTEPITNCDIDCSWK